MIETPPPARYVTTAWCLLVMVVFLLLQLVWGAFDSDLGGDPDEAAHAVTALMVHDYLWQGLGSSPLGFATEYYETFPKVALGHYPPLYYLPGAAALSVWCSPKALLALQALWVGLLGVVSWRFARRWLTAGDGWLAVLPWLMFVSLTEVLRVGGHVLADLLLSLLVFAALLAWHRYLVRPGWKWALSFGGLAAAAILTKGSAMGLAGVPVLSLVLAGHWQDLRRLHWWGAALPVALLAGPWMLYSVRFTQEGFVDQTPLAFFAEAIRFYRIALPQVYGWPMVSVIAISLLRLGWDALQRRVEPARAVLWAGVLSMQGLVMIVPTGFSNRYLVPSLLPLALLMLIELTHWVPWVLRRMDAVGSLVRTQRWVVLLLVGSTLWLTWRVQPKQVRGYTEVVERLLAASDPAARTVWLIASDPRGEGAVIAATAFATPDRTASLLSVRRGSKTLVDTDWLGKSYQPKFADAASLLRLLDAEGIDVVMVDTSMTPDRVQAHEKALRKALDQSDSGWQVVWKQTIQRGFGVPEGDLLVYQRRTTAAGGSAP
jgi:hypothetical protein